ncbi:ethanolamine ammonia-lyase subunit EutC [Fictibacillus aquaticus]|uniref:Ethanolamine ammonia-lyase small subunit n=1 Tax=Fictibacillus aquaticus TaxID=2021314 RepID=A0A235F3V9_9BACL|nr:ethanolamine ammonia-lyase subunit EutC [Fictibacillus aquaticus]OYD55960.1 ethanolamine ammonia-lyase [Fictibacillus aquaticus]
MNKNQIEDIVSKVLANLGNTQSPKQPTQREDDAFHFSKEDVIGVENPKNKQTIAHARSITPARIGIGHTGTRMLTSHYLNFRIDHAAAQDAVLKDVDEEILKQLGLPILQTKAEDMQTYLMNLDSGRRLNEESETWLKKNGEKGKQVQVIVCDGLSSTAVEENIADLLPAINQGLSLKGITFAKPLFVKNARVWVQDHVAQIVNCDVIISLIGERPGLASAKSISAYMIYKPNEKTVEADRTVISNIHEGGLSPVEAGAHLSDIIADMLKYQASGVHLAKQRNQ